MVPGLARPPPPEQPHTCPPELIRPPPHTFFFEQPRMGNVCLLILVQGRKHRPETNPAPNIRWPVEQWGKSAGPTIGWAGTLCSGPSLNTRASHLQEAPKLVGPGGTLPLRQAPQALPLSRAPTLTQPQPSSTPARGSVRARELSCQAPCAGCRFLRGCLLPAQGCSCAPRPRQLLHP